jgi:hypothetical protein
MYYSGKSRRRSLSAKVCVLTLGLAVFLWGTQYKLSLYFAPSESHPNVPTAKLLCPEDSPFALAKAGCPDVKAGSATTPHAFSFVVTAHTSAHAQLIQRVDQPRQYASPAQSASFIHFASRPPPTSIPPISSI